MSHLKFTQPQLTTVFLAYVLNLRMADGYLSPFQWDDRTIPTSVGRWEDHGLLWTPGLLARGWYLLRFVIWRIRFPIIARD